MRGRKPRWRAVRALATDQAVVAADDLAVTLSHTGLRRHVEGRGNHIA